MMISFNPNRTNVPQRVTLLLSTRDAAKALQVSERTLYSYTKAGLIRCVAMPSTGPKQATKAKRYALSELERFILEHQTPINSDNPLNSKPTSNEADLLTTAEPR